MNSLFFVNIFQDIFILYFIGMIIHYAINNVVETQLYILT
jgi:hypothetical protein